eukprot:Phypoly_transcript_15047.p1 GENE.Phypoly_transcript_15047~~Phypoly_transcript_15047.p1  ORF type:complete len:230 (+),score=21.68 Phypoly_transcript_15047:3-692(+)
MDETVVIEEGIVLNTISNTREQIVVRPITDVDLDRIRPLHEEWFPVKYDNDFYATMAHNTSSFPVTFAMAAVKAETGEVIGVITGQVNKEWQVEDTELLSFKFREQELMYITTLGVIDLYRKQGIATLLLKTMLDFCEIERPSVSAIYLHVLTTNSHAIKFYEKHKFTCLRKLAAYYEIGENSMDSFLYIMYINDGLPPGSSGNALDYGYDQMSQLFYSALGWFGCAWM